MLRLPTRQSLVFHGFFVNKVKITIDFIIHILYNDFYKMKGSYVTNEQKVKSWIDYLSAEELAFVKRFVLASGSLKEIARIYGVSYPTVRLRLDRLIEMIKIVDSQQISSEFERVLRAKYAEAKIDVDTFKTLLSLHHKSGGGSS